MTQTTNSWRMRAHETLNDWQYQLRDLEMRAKLLEARLRSEADEQLTDLRQRWQMTRARLDDMSDNTEDRWYDMRNKFEARLEEVRSRFNWVRPDNTPRQTDSDSWAEGMGHPARDSEGWVEGMGQQTHDSEGWAEGMGHQTHDSEGWTEGMNDPSEGQHTPARR